MPNQRILFLLSFALSTLSPNCMAETKRPVRFMVLDTVSMPFANVENIGGQLKLIDGAMKQWQEEHEISRENRRSQRCHHRRGR